MTSFTTAVARLLVATALVAAVALLVKGYSGAGDGFSAGTLAALAVVMRAVAAGPTRWAESLSLWGNRSVLAAFGGTIMLAVVLAGPLLGGPLLGHWPPHGAPRPLRLGSLEMHTALIYDLGIAIVVFVTIVSVIDLVAGEPRKGGPG